MNAARERLAVLVAERAPRLCRHEPAELGDLALLWLRTQPEFAQAMHGLLDGPAGAGLSSLTQAEYEAGLERLREAERGARQDAEAADRAARGAAERRNAVEQGRA